MLPPPPDIRRVVLSTDQVAESEIAKYQVPVWSQPSRITVNLPQGLSVAERNKAIMQGQPRETINSGNTTIIGDYVAAAFESNDTKWLVQAHGTATFDSVINNISTGSLTVQCRYIFLVLGHNQVWSITKQELTRKSLELVVLIRSLNAECRIYFTPALPRPVDNEVAKPCLVKYNCNLFMAVRKMESQLNRVHFVPIQHAFIGEDSKPILAYFNEDLVTLNKVGAACLKMKLFEYAGFRVNL